VLAALTVLRAFHVAGRPQQTVPLGSFEDWSLFVRDALVWLGEADPCATMERARAEDPKLEALTNVVEQWYAVLKDKIVSVKDVIDKATGLDLVLNRLDFNRREYLHPDFREALLIVAGEGGAINSRRLGKWLAANKNRVVGGKRIEPETMLNGISRWRISCLT
jgi:putative DNA primase/helicase